MKSLKLTCLQGLGWGGHWRELHRGVGALGRGRPLATWPLLCKAPLLHSPTYPLQAGPCQTALPLPKAFSAPQGGVCSF